MKIKSSKTFDQICEELGLRSQFLLELSMRCSSLYTTYDIPKRSGGTRTISVPDKNLKSVQRALLDIIFHRFEMPDHVHGCVKGRSIATNAKGHTNQTLVINIDLKNFFGTIKYAQVVEIFKNHFNFDDQSSEIFARLTTYGDCLPQGAPTSPTLANIAALKLDTAILDICKENLAPGTFHYSRYVDDISVSGGRELGLLIHAFYQSIFDLGFKANTKKLRIQRQSDRQKVTGITVNKKLNPSKKLVRKVRQQIYYCKKFGVAQHCKQVGIDPISYQEKIYGELGFIGMMRPDLEAWFNLDLKKATETYYPNTNSEEQKLLFLVEAIDKELKIEFEYDFYGSYEDESVVAVPVEIFVNEYGHKSLRGYQLEPDQGWKKYFVADIRNLRAVE
ncbi:MAG: reverse transcriptase family protein [Candidatus Melainabacteria bacterium]|nr:reverse transcriptase family protein [Candidatus Melainabacteria bacterium]